ncbi:hypothetical protein TL16_g01014 [Triparma laevis f. inornata]|uniref:NFACT RNA-binding domain-containing protein n=2 Tax=Triparma laevis TaxID=1534972 RepID=A0A9W7FRJ8_9STRA|nr:hypothetical protein TL16_g01014 [Triparma laevis f. inornata]GMI16860.1 hypothetical protein TrLO_g1693 [Triparma laevis f. longispina]
MRIALVLIMLLATSTVIRSFRHTLLVHRPIFHHATTPPGRLFLSDPNSGDSAPKPAAAWNLKILKNKITNKIIRTHKKIGKGGPNLDTHMSTLQALTTLESLLSSPSSDVDAIVSAALSLDLDDLPSNPQPRGPKKMKGPKAQSKSRKPFRTYTFENITILVGKKAEDNDILSVGEARGEPNEVWLHASGYAGSHVVIKCDFDETPRPVLNAGALLAAKYSKNQSNRAKVNYTRCRNVSKPIGAKPGLVKLGGDVGVIEVDLKIGEGFLEELEEAVKIN